MACLWAGIAAARLAADDTGAIVEQWLAHQTNVVSWTARLTQTRRLQALTQPLVTPGRVWFSAPDTFRWELGEPARSIAIRRGDLLTVLSPKLQRAERHSLAELARGPMKESLALLDTGFPRDAGEFGRRFRTVGTVTTNAVHRLTLEPRDPAARRFLPRLVVEVATNSWQLTATELRLADGSELRNDFTDAQSNAAVDPAQFDPEPPAGYRVTDASRP
jgi:outer membrane lipoprotein carrier protein